MTPRHTARPGDLFSAIDMPALIPDLDAHALFVCTTAAHAVLANLDAPALR